MKSSTTEQFTKVALSTLESSNINPSTKQSQKLKKAKLNLFGKGITHVKALNEEQIAYFQQIKQIDLSHNAISSIENLKSLPLESLNLSHNKFIEQQAIFSSLIRQKNSELSKNLKKICIKGNPFMKKPLSAETRRYLFSVQNDLELYTRDQLQFLDLLVQRVVEKNTLQNMLNKTQINLQFIKEYSLKLEDQYQKLLIIRPEEYFKLLRRQMEWKLQSEEPFLNIKKAIVSCLPIELFASARQKSQLKQFASPLVLQLRKRNQQIAKQNKQIVPKIQNTIFTYLTQKKMLIQKQYSQNQLSAVQSIKTPLKNLYNINPDVNRSEKIKDQPYQHEQYPEVNTPINLPNSAIVSKQVTPIMRLTETIQFNLNQVQMEKEKTQSLTKQQGSFFQTSIKKNQRNPFQQIVSETKQKNVEKNKQNIIDPSIPPTIITKKPDIKNSSKTLFELSQSLLQKPVVMSDQSISFQMQEGLIDSQVQKMFFSILTKLNPIYQLLLSPIQSLKATQKNQLIYSLLDLLKEKFKYVEKLEKFKVMYEEEKKKCELFEATLQQYKNTLEQSKNNINMLEVKNQMLQQELRDVESEVKKVSFQMQSKAQEIFLLKERNQTLNQKILKINDFRLENQEQQRIEEIIRSKNQQRLTIKYLSILNKKAQKILSFKTNMQSLGCSNKKHIIGQTFIAWIKQTVTSKHYKNLHSSVMLKNIKFFTSTLGISINIKKKNQQKTLSLTKALKTMKFQSFMLRLKDNKSVAIKFAQAKAFDSKKIKRKIFQNFIQNRQCQKIMKTDQMVNEFRLQSKQRMKKWVFNQWLVWQRGIAHKEIEVQVNHEGVLACQVISNLCQFYSDQKLHQSKSLALQLYMRDMRKLNSFHRLLHQMSVRVQKWKLKLFKINFFTKRTYFDNFLSGVRRKKNRRRIKEKEDEVIKKKLVLNELNEKKLKRSFLMEKLSRKIKEGYAYLLNQRMQHARRQMIVEKLFKNKRADAFFDNFRTIYKSKNSISIKQKQVAYRLKIYKQRMEAKNSFTSKSFFKYMRNSLRLKHRLRKFFTNKNKNLLHKTFYRLRVGCLSQKSHFFEQKLKQLGPDIQLIESKQIQASIQKMTLTRQIGFKNQQIQEYQKEVRELKLLLEAKEIKYEKLKDIYAESVEINSRGREIYDEIEKSLGHPQISFELKPPNNILSNRFEEERNFQKTVRLQQKPEGSRKRTFNYTKYSPEHDVKMSKQKNKMNQYTIMQKLTQNQEKEKSQRKENYNKERVSEFYPSFRRF